MHYANCATFNADFDGDEINLHLPQARRPRHSAVGARVGPCVRRHASFVPAHAGHRHSYLPHLCKLMRRGAGFARLGLQAASGACPQPSLCDRYSASVRRCARAACRTARQARRLFHTLTLCGRTTWAARRATASCTRTSSTSCPPTASPSAGSSRWGCAAKSYHAGFWRARPRGDSGGAGPRQCRRPQCSAIHAGISAAAHRQTDAACVLAMGQLTRCGSTSAFDMRAAQHLRDVNGHARRFRAALGAQHRGTRAHTRACPSARRRGARRTMWWRARC
jgi:hypothetical protein